MSSQRFLGNQQGNHIASMLMWLWLRTGLRICICYFPLCHRKLNMDIWKRASYLQFRQQKKEEQSIQKPTNVYYG